MEFPALPGTAGGVEAVGVVAAVWVVPVELEV